jgi:ABC-2 type transport system permease protein
MNPQETLNAYIAITRKEIVRFMRIWTQTLLPPVITQSLYFIIFGNFIGSRVGDVRGVDKVEIKVPG